MLEERVGASIGLILFDLSVKPSLVQVSHLIKEAVTVNGQLIDNLLNDRLHLHKRVDPTTDLLIQDLKDDSQEFVNRHFTCGLVVKELHHEPNVLK